MKNMLDKESQQTSGHSTATCAFNNSSWRNSSVSIPHSSVSRSTSLNMDSPNYHCHNVKQLGLQLQDQDSSLTQSTCESHHELATNGGGKFHGYDETNGRQGDDQIKSVFPPTTPYFGLAPPQLDYNQSVARIPYPYAEPYYGGLASAYGAQAIGQMQIASQTMGMAPTRVPLPLDLAEEEPIFVNAKQYHAILRRRECRAKLEAQNKLAKARKPYLHESRHLHALKRVRGSGGRFVNTKNQQEPDPSTNTNVQNESEMALMQTGDYLSESESGRAGASTAACSDITSISNTDDYKFQRQSDIRLSGYPLPPHNGHNGGGAGTVMNGNGYQHHRGVHIIR